MAMGSNWQLTHVGLIVRDKNRVVDYYRSLGIGVDVGPQPPGPALSEEQKALIRTTIYGRRVEIDWSRPAEEKAHWEGNVQIGDLQLEVLQSAPDSFQWRHSEKASEGISHICYNVPDIMGETARLTGKGLRIIFSIEGDGWIGENYLDTGRHGGLWLSMRPPKDRWFSAWEAERLSNRLVSNWKFHGAGIAVRDLDQTVDYYRSLEIAAFQTERVFDSSSTADFQPGGKSAGSRFRARKRAAMLGSTVYEFVQPLEGDTIYSQALYSRGEGVNDIGFLVNDLDMEAAKLVGKGLPVVLSGKPSEGHAFAFFDTRPEGGNIMLKLMQA